MAMDETSGESEFGVVDRRSCPRTMEKVFSNEGKGSNKINLGTNYGERVVKTFKKFENTILLFEKI